MNSIQVLTAKIQIYPPPWPLFLLLILVVVTVEVEIASIYTN